MMMRRPLVLALSWLFLFLDSNGVHADSAKQQQTPTRGVPLPTARDVLREKFPSGLKIDRFSASWPQSSASFMSDLLEGAAAREWLERQQGSKKKGRTTSNKNNQVATTLPPRSFPSPQSAKKSSDNTKESGLSPRGLLGLAAAGVGLGVASFAADGKAVPPNAPTRATGGGTATIPEHTFNLVKAIVGVGVLSLPSGIAAFGNAKSALIPAVALITVMGILSAVGFAWIGEVCAITGARSYAEAWARTVSPKTAKIPAWSTTIKTFLACLAFSMVLADSLTALAPIDSRTAVLWTVTGTILLPLCWLKNLKSLAPFSLLGVMGMLYTACAMTFRFLRGSYLEGSPLLSDLATKVQPAFGDKGIGAVASPQSVILVSMLSTAYMAHFSAPKYQVELKDNTIPRFHTVVALGFGISILLTAWIAGIGFATFGGACDGLVLNNYSTNDVVMSISRSAVAISLIFSYPLAFQGCRDGFLDLLGIQDRSPSKLNLMTGVLLLVLTSLATVLKDVSFVLAFGGATLGNLLCYVYPALMYRQVRPDRNVPAVALAVSGVVLGAIGASRALKNL